MIESGSLTPGVDPSTFGLPPHTAVRFERPAAPLRALVNTYHVLDSERAFHHGAMPWMLPSWPMIRFILAPDRIALRIGSRAYDPMPAAALHGTAGTAMRMTTHGGVTIGVDLTPLGWARLFSAHADQYRDRVTPLETMLPGAWVDQTMQRLRESDRGAQVTAILDEMLLAIVGPPGRDEPQIAALLGMIHDDRTTDLTIASHALGLSPAAVRRLSARYFGFPPKPLLIRVRFMRTLVRMMLAGDAADYKFVPPSYFDASHFLRDAKRFLGMTPRQFMKEDHRYLIACLRARRAVLTAARAIEHSPVAAVVGRTDTKPERLLST